MSAEDLFAKEISILNHAEEFCDQNDWMNDPHKKIEFETLIKSYRKLFKQTKRLVNINDRQQLELQKQKEELEELNAQLLEDLTVAGEVQKAIFPTLKNPDFLDISIQYLPHSKVSGDLYYFQKTSNDEFEVFLGDATGHGITAAFLTIMANMALLNKSGTPDLRETLQYLNDQLEQRTPDNRFLSAIYLRVMPNGQFTFVNAGHPPFIIIPANTDKPIVDKIDGPLLGLFPSELIQFDECEGQLHAGDKLLLYTDGITEYPNPAGHQYDLDRFLQCLETHRSKNPEQLLLKVLEDVNVFSQDQKPADDVTLIAIEYQP